MSKPTLKDLCKEHKGTKTNQSIAEATNLSISTVANFFASASKEPSVYTAGPICRECGVSMDEYFGIVAESAPSELELAQMEIDHLRERMTDKEHEIKRKNNLIFIGAVVLIFLIAYMFATDLINPTIGMFRGEFTAAGVIALVGLGAAAVAVLYFASQEIQITFKHSRKK